MLTKSNALQVFDRVAALVKDPVMRGIGYQILLLAHNDDLSPPPPQRDVIAHVVNIAKVQSNMAPILFNHVLEALDQNRQAWRSLSGIVPIVDIFSLENVSPVQKLRFLSIAGETMLNEIPTLVRVLFAEFGKQNLSADVLLNAAVLVSELANGAVLAEAGFLEIFIIGRSPELIGCLFSRSVFTSMFFEICHNPAVVDRSVQTFQCVTRSIDFFRDRNSAIDTLVLLLATFHQPECFIELQNLPPELVLEICRQTFTSSPDSIPRFLTGNGILYLFSLISDVDCSLICDLLALLADATDCELLEHEIEKLDTNHPLFSIDTE